MGAVQGRGEAGGGSKTQTNLGAAAPSVGENTGLAKQLAQTIDILTSLRSLYEAPVSLDEVSGWLNVRDVMWGSLSARFENAVKELALSANELAEERRTSTVAIAELDACGDRIDRIQRENRATLNSLLAS